MHWGSGLVCFSGSSLDFRGSRKSLTVVVRSLVQVLRPGLY